MATRYQTTSPVPAQTARCARTQRDLAYWNRIRIELTAPDRSAPTAAGLRRIGLSDRECRYFDLHAVLNVKHSADWNQEAIRPAVEEDPRRARAMVEGALIRLRCGERCSARYRQVFWAPRGMNDLRAEPAA